MEGQMLMHERLNVRRFVELIFGHKGAAGKNSDIVGLVLCDLVSVEKSTAGNVSADKSFADLSKG